MRNDDPDSLPSVRISLIIPNYNHGKFIKQALDALFEQTRPADEIIIIDDASTDDSVTIIEELVKGHANVSVVRNETNGGVLKTLNEGLARASGDLIAFPAADDVVYPEFLEKTARMLCQFPAAPFCSACVNLIDGNGQYFGSRPLLRPMGRTGFCAAETFRSLLRRGDNFFLGPVTLYRVSRLKELGGFDPDLQSTADAMMQRRMAARWGFCFIPEVLGTWRIHDRNYSVSSLATPDKVEHLVEKIQTVLKNESHGLFPENYSQIFERRLRFNAARLILGQHQGKSLDRQQLEDLCMMMRATKTDRILLRIFQGLGVAADVFRLGWLGLRLRPFSFIWLAKEGLRRLSFSRRRRSQH